MSGKQERKFEELSVDGPAFRAVIEQALKRQEARVGLRAMIDEWGLALRDVVTRPGEIERMVKDYRDLKRANGDPGADEQAKELEIMLVEIRRRVEEGVLRFSRKKPAKNNTDQDSASSNAEAADQAAEAEVTKSNQDGHGGSAADEGERGDTRIARTALSGNAPEAGAVARNAEADPIDDGDDEGWRGSPNPPPELRTAELADEVSDGREDDQEVDDGEASRPDPQATDWRSPLGGDGTRDDS